MESKIERKNNHPSVGLRVIGRYTGTVPDAD